MKIIFLKKRKTEKLIPKVQVSNQQEQQRTEATGIPHELTLSPFFRGRRLPASAF